MSNRRLLIAFAHPDDESFGLGGFIARCVDEGIDVYYACATNGDVGTVSPEMLNGYASIKELRLSELDRASEILGFKKVFKLGYKDSGMMGDPANDDPESLWWHGQNKPEEVIRRMVEVIREVQPQVVITFNKYGGYGHPDHIAIQRATVEAFSLAGNTNYLTHEQIPYQPQKLYYNSMPTMMLRLAVMRLRLQGKDPRKLGRNQDIDLVKILDYVEPTHARVSVRRYLETWDRANACHASQGGGRTGFIPRWMRRMLFVQQGFTRVYPKPSVDTVDESDLFVGVRLDERELVGA